MNLANCKLLSVQPESRVWHRAIRLQHLPTALQTAQTKLFPSRFNAGVSAHPQFEILYLAENQMVALFEARALLGSPTTSGVVPPPRQTLPYHEILVLFPQKLQKGSFVEFYDAVGKLLHRIP